MAKKGISEVAQAAIKNNFDLGKFKKNKGLASASVKFKEQKWIPLSKAFQDITSIPGIPQGHITLLRGHSDTGKTTALLEAAVAAQKMGVLPVFIITEMKWSWEHAREMGRTASTRNNYPQPSRQRRLGILKEPVRGTVCGHHPCLVGDTQLREKLAGWGERVEITRTTHHHTDQWRGRGSDRAVGSSGHVHSKRGIGSLHAPFPRLRGR